MSPDRPLNDSSRNVSVRGDTNAPIVTGDCNTLSTHHTTQNGQVNISGQQIGKVIINQPSASEDNFFKADELCQNRQALMRYREGTLKTLRENGCLEVRTNIEQGSHQFSQVARIEDFELPFWPVTMRGEAFFVFSEFSSLHMKLLRQFSGRAVQWAKPQVKAGAVSRAAYNFRIPAHFCFAIALVDDLDEVTKQAIHTTNPFDHSLDLMWYEVPVVYELNQSQLHFYDQPSGFLENFKGEVAWMPLRKVARELLAGRDL